MISCVILPKADQHKCFFIPGFPNRPATQKFCIANLLPSSGASDFFSTTISRWVCRKFLLKEGNACYIKSLPLCETAWGHRRFITLIESNQIFCFLISFQLFDYAVDTFRIVFCHLYFNARDRKGVV